MPRKRLTLDTLWGPGMTEMASVPLEVGNLPKGVTRCPSISRSCEKKTHLVGLN